MWLKPSPPPHKAASLDTNNIVKGEKKLHQFEKSIWDKTGKVTYQTYQFACTKRFLLVTLSKHNSTKILLGIIFLGIKLSDVIWLHFLASTERVILTWPVYEQAADVRLSSFKHSIFQDLRHVAVQGYGFVKWLHCLESRSAWPVNWTYYHREYSTVLSAVCRFYLCPVHMLLADNKVALSPTSRQVCVYLVSFCCCFFWL